MSTKIQSILARKDPQFSYDPDYCVYNEPSELLICGWAVNMFIRRKKMPDKIRIKAYLTNKQSKPKRGWVKIALVKEYNWYSWTREDDDDKCYEDMYSAMCDAINKKFPQLRVRTGIDKIIYLFLRIEEYK